MGQTPLAAAGSVDRTRKVPGRLVLDRVGELQSNVSALINKSNKVTIDHWSVVTKRGAARTGVVSWSQQQHMINMAKVMWSDSQGQTPPPGTGSRAV